MFSTKQVERSTPSRKLRAARRAGVAYQANREALEPPLRLLLDAALAARMYPRSAPGASEREPQGVS